MKLDAEIFERCVEIFPSERRTTCSARTRVCLCVYARAPRSYVVLLSDGKISTHLSNISASSFIRHLLFSFYNNLLILVLNKQPKKATCCIICLLSYQFNSSMKLFIYTFFFMIFFLAIKKMYEIE